MTGLRIMPGDQVEALDAHGVWQRGIAASEVEGMWVSTAGRARRAHDFPVIWVAFESSRVPWPAEHVRLAGDPQ